MPGEQQLALFDVNFLHALMHDDDLGAIVRGQTFIEDRLQALVARNLRDPAVIPWNEGSWNFARLKELAVAMGELSASDAQIINRLAKLRNEFAHKRHMELTPAMVQRLHEGLDDDSRATIDSLPRLSADYSEHSQMLRKIILITKMTLDARAETPLYKTASVRRIRKAVKQVVRQATLLSRSVTLWEASDS